MQPWEIERLGKSTDQSLMREYLELNKARFDRMFGRNAARAQSEVAKILHARGIYEIPNIFGPIPVQE